jgi:hypothetical protein
MESKLILNKLIQSVNTKNIIVYEIHPHKQSKIIIYCDIRGRDVFLLSTNSNFQNYIGILKNAIKNKTLMTITYESNWFSIDVLTIEKYIECIDKYQKSGQFNCKLRYGKEYYAIYFFDIEKTFYIKKGLFKKNPMIKDKVYDFSYYKEKNKKIISKYNTFNELIETPDITKIIKLTKTRNITIDDVYCHCNSNVKIACSITNKTVFLSSDNPCFEKYIDVLTDAVKNKTLLTITYESNNSTIDILTMEEYISDKYQKTAQYNCKLNHGTTKYYDIFFVDGNETFHIEKVIINANPMVKGTIYDFYYYKENDMKIISKYNINNNNN